MQSGGFGGPTDRTWAQKPPFGSSRNYATPYYTTLHYNDIVYAMSPPPSYRPIAQWELGPNALRVKKNIIL